MNICVVIPTYNEAANIREVVTRALSAYDDIHVIVVDDNSTDGTGVIADQLSSCHANVSVVHRPAKAGLGSAYRHGFSAAIAQGADVILEMDADLSHEPESIPRLIARIDEGADLVIGSRYVPGGNTVGWPLRRKMLSRWGNVYMRVLARTDVRDATGGFRAFNVRTAAEHVLPTQSEGYAFQIETVVRCRRAGLEINEVPITFVERRAGSSKMDGQIVLEAVQYGWNNRWLRHRGERDGALPRRPLADPVGPSSRP